MSFFRNLLAVILVLIFICPSISISDNQDFFEEEKILEKDINILTETIPFFDISGNKHFFDEFDGTTILIVFWATWVNESPELIISLDYLKKDFRKLKFDVIAISEDYQNIDKIHEFFDKHEIRHLKIYHDYKNQIYNSMKITNLPSFFLLTSDSNNLYQFQGKVNWNEEHVRNSLLGFIPGNPAIQKNSFSKTILKFSPEYKAKTQLKKSQKTVLEGKDLIDGKEVGKVINTDDEIKNNNENKDE